MSVKLTRRAALATAAAAPLAASVALPARADGHAAQAMRSDTHRTFSIGDFEVSTLLSGTRTVDNDPQETFGMNVDAETFQQVSAANFIPSDKTQFFFTPTVVKTGSEVVLFDTGLNPGAITTALASAGIAPEDVNTVVITHMHGDHIGGISGDGGETFANARYVTHQAEFDHWNGTDNENFANKIKPIAEKFEFISDGGSVTSGVTAMEATGHTPGHTVYMLESAGEQLVLTADLANHYVWSLAYPDWEVRFDMDKAAAAAARRTVLGMLAADKIPFVGYHMPFPGVGFVDTRDDGFRYVPESYQFAL
ncbi:MAG: MBL fold metallo-hydrolase [Pseudomonadota bacterium]